MQQLGLYAVLVLLDEDSALWASVVVFLSVLVGIVSAYWFALRKPEQATTIAARIQPFERFELPPNCFAGWLGTWQLRFPRECPYLRTPVRDTTGHLPG